MTYGCFWILLLGSLSANGIIFKNLGTKTPYAYEANNSTSHFTGCKINSLFYLIRHGTRYPSSGERKSITVDLKSFVDRESTFDFPDLPSVDAKWINLLHHEGEAEMYELGARFSRRFFRYSGHKDECSATPKVRFVSSRTERTENSAKSFGRGFLGSRSITVSKNDPLLKFYKFCPSWASESAADISREIGSFEDSPSFKNSINSFKTRNRFSQVLLKDFNAVYTACRFTQAWRPWKPSLWCQLFSPEEFAVLEYREDIKYFWSDGYSKDLNYKPACVVLKNILNILENDQISFNFAHSKTLRKVLASLNFFKDNIPVKSSTFEELKRHRKWRSTKMSPFGGNLMILKRSCFPGSAEVGFYINERFARVPGCSTDFCNYSSFISLLSKPCDFEKLCRI